MNNQIMKITNLQCLEQYLYVSRCWQSPTLAAKEEMTFEKAVKLLAPASVWTDSKLLRSKCRSLMDAIIHGQEEPEYLKEPTAKI